MAENHTFYVDTTLLKENGSSAIERGSPTHLAYLDVVAYKKAELSAKDLELDHVDVLEAVRDKRHVDSLGMARDREYLISVQRMANAQDRMAERSATLPDYANTLAMLSNWVATVEGEDGSLVATEPGKVVQKGIGITLEDWLEKIVK